MRAFGVFEYVSLETNDERVLTPSTKSMKDNTRRKRVYLCAIVRSTVDSFGLAGKIHVLQFSRCGSTARAPHAERDTWPC